MKDIELLSAYVKSIESSKPGTQKILADLGASPWNEELLTKFYYASFTATNAAVEQHPGSRLSRALSGIRQGLILFEDEVDKFTMTAFEADLFHKRPDAYLPRTKFEKERIEWSLQKYLYHAASAAYTLVNLGRKVRARLSNTHKAKYNQFKVEIFDDSQSGFIKELRNSFVHIQLPSAYSSTNTKFETGGKISKTRVLIQFREIESFQDWTVDAKRFCKGKEELDIVNVLNDYRSRVHEFNNKLITYIENLYDSDLLDYRRCSRITKKISARASYNLLLQATKPGKTNPWNHLEKFLSEEQINRVSLLKNGSKAQVDLIIILADEYEAVDDEIRQKLYDLFASAPKATKI